jgi:sugar phosphate isomerase/epimerase
MTLAYGEFAWERALEGVARAGFRHVAWGVSHRGEDGVKRAVLDAGASLAVAAGLARQCRALGLSPEMLFSTVNLEAADAVALHQRRIAQAAAAGVPFLLTFGKTQGGDYARAVETLRAVGPMAEQSKVMVVVKQHGGNTGTGALCAKLLAAAGEFSHVKICYDAGNVLDYENADPVADLRECVGQVRAFALKDHRNWPRDEDCAPGLGEIDHYRLLAQVMDTEWTMPLAFENVSEPLRERPERPEIIDGQMLRARQYVETVLAGLRGLTKEERRLR